MIGRILKWVGLGLMLAITLLIVANCTMLGLNYASLDTANKPDARPAITAPGLDAWQDGRAGLKRDFETHVYGAWPAGLAVRLTERRLVDDAFAGGRARLEELTIRIGAGKGARTFQLGLAVPHAGRQAPMGLVIGQTFSSNCTVFETTALRKDETEACSSADLPWIAEYIFGEYIANVPFEAYFDAGFAYASFHASDFVPDRSRQAGVALAALAAGEASAPTGTLMAWAYGYKAVIDVLAGEPWLDPDRIAVYGHSRHGKSALLAGIWDRRVDAVISHQSGFGGAALSRSDVGEGVERITRIYPHWFDPAFAAHADDPARLPVDQHQLLALMAPTPVFIGNARRDVWSDPNSTFRAAQGADPVYQLYGTAGLTAETMLDYDPAAPLAYWLRPGGHGTDRRDIDAILAFLTAHLGSAAP